MTIVEWLLLLALIVNCIQLYIIINNLQVLLEISGRKSPRKQHVKEYI